MLFHGLFFCLIFMWTSAAPKANVNINVDIDVNQGPHASSSYEGNGNDTDLEKRPCSRTKRNGGGSCNDYSYRRRYTANGKPCDFGTVGTVEPIPIITNECNNYFGDPEERCIYDDGNGEGPLIFGLCGGNCNIAEKFRRDHMCSWCNTWQNALTFTLARVQNGDKISRNHIFRSGLSIGKSDWAFNSNVRANKLQPICRIPEYVLTWYCQKINNVWMCWEEGYYTGGGLAIGVEGHTAGHFLPTSLHMYTNN